MLIDYEKSEAIQAKNLLYLRERAGLSRADLRKGLDAQGLKISETAIRRVEDGSRPLRAVELGALCTFFRVPIVDFLYSPMTQEDLTAELSFKMQQSMRDFDKSLNVVTNAIETIGSRYLDIMELAFDYAKAINEPIEATDGFHLFFDYYGINPEKELNVPNDANLARAVTFLSRYSASVEQLNTVRERIASLEDESSVADTAMRLMGGGSN